MNHFFKWALSCALLLGLPNLSNAGDNMIDQEKAVLAAVETMTTSFEAGDIDTVMASYEVHATVMFQPGEGVSDPDQLHGMFTGMSGAKPKFSYSGHEVIVNDDIAIHIAPWQMKATGPDGTPIEQEGLSVAVLRKQADGSWKMVIDNPHGSRLMADN